MRVCIIFVGAIIVCCLLLLALIPLDALINPANDPSQGVNGFIQSGDGFWILIGVFLMFVVILLKNNKQ